MVFIGVRPGVVARAWAFASTGRAFTLWQYLRGGIEAGRIVSEWCSIVVKKVYINGS